MLEKIISFILAWYNLPFTLLIITGGALALLQLVGLSSAEEGEVEHDLDHDLDHDADGDGDSEADHDTDQDAEHESDSTFSLLAFLGVGKAPLIVIMLLMCGSIGLLGWTLNSLTLGLMGAYPALIVALIWPGAALAGGTVAAWAARFIGRALPPLSTTAARAESLVGRRGKVISPFVDHKYGLVHLRNTDGTLISVFAVTASERELRRGEEVVLVDYDAGHKKYMVTQG